MTLTRPGPPHPPCPNTLLEAYLHSHFWEVNFHGQLFTAVNVGVVGLLEGTLQFVQLVGGEGGSVAPVFLFGLIFLRGFRRAAVTFDTSMMKISKFSVAFVTREESCV